MAQIKKFKYRYDKVPEEEIFRTNVEKVNVENVYSIFIV